MSTASEELMKNYTELMKSVGKLANNVNVN